MGLLDWEYIKIEKPGNARERNYAILGRKLVNQDSIIFNKFKEEYVNKLKTVDKIFRSLIILIFIPFLMAIFNWNEYARVFTLYMSILVFFIFLIYIVFIIPYAWHGLYARSWIKLLGSKELIPKISFMEKLVYKSHSIFYPKILSYLEAHNISKFITEEDLRYFASSSKDLEKLKRKHEIYDNSMIKFNEKM